jgi:TRAP-type C4-dicarboxylate transport system permease small subunit
MGIYQILGLLFAVYLGICGVATVRLWSSDFYSHGQKAAQTALLWMLPVIGLILVLAVLKAEPRRPRTFEESDDDDDADDDIGVAGSAPDHAVASADG